MVGARLDNMAALALVPEHLHAYVRAISGMDVHFCAGCPCYAGEGGEAVLVGYPPDILSDGTDWTPDVASRVRAVVDSAVAAALALPHKPFRQLTVLAPVRPSAAPADASEEQDIYWALPLPLPRPLPQKVRNMLTSASRLVRLDQRGGAGSWTDGHKELVRHFCASHTDLEAGSIYIFEHLGDWLDASRHAQVFSAYGHDGQLLASAVGDFTSLDTAFYMFAFREPYCPPGVADLLLYRIAQEAMRRGHVRLNLGLGINAGVTFFKRKWGAREMCPLVTTSWHLGA